MPTFEYVAWDATGCCKQGLKTADSEEQLLAQLRSEQLTPVSVKQAHGAAEVSAKKTGGKRVKSHELATFCWQLSAMLDGGLPITTAIYTIADEMPNKKFEMICKDIAVQLENGRSLTEAVGFYADTFGRMGCAMVMAGEASGSLVQTLQRLADYYENRDKLARKVRGAMAYPLFVLGFVVVIIIAMMTLIIPRFAMMFAEMGDKLPAFTRGFMAVYHSLMAGMPYIVAGLICAGMGVAAISKTKSGHRALSALMLKIPLLGKIITMAFVATFCKTLGILINAGVSVIDALKILSQISSNDILADAVRQTHENLVKGSSIARSMETSKLFPGVAVKMVQIGEQSGSLVSVLDKTSDYYARKVEQLIAMMLGLLEPILIVSVGSIVLVVLLAMYMPIFSMSA